MYNELDETSVAVYENTQEKWLREILKRESYLQVYLFSLSLFYPLHLFPSTLLAYKVRC